MDAESVKREQREVYALGDYSWLSRWFMPAAETLAESCDVRPTHRVLDVAAGDGNAAVAAGRRGATVTATDLTPEQVRAGAKRCRADGLSVDWSVADAEDLPFADGSFERVVSTFGVVYAPRPRSAAGELFRVLAPGGVVGITAWTPGGFNDQVMAAAQRHMPSDAAEEPELSPEDWGDDATARARLAPFASAVDVTIRTLERRARSSSSLWAEARRHVPFLQSMAATMSADAFAAFGEAYRRIVDEHSRPDGGGITLAVEYAEIVARK